MASVYAVRRTGKSRSKPVLNLCETKEIAETFVMLYVDCYKMKGIHIKKMVIHNKPLVINNDKKYE